MSVKKRTKPGVAIIYSDVPYAAAHNEGTNNAGRGHKTRIPKRQFIGESRTLNKKAMKIIEDELKRIMND
jgi:phage gpG-like protein